MITIIKRLLSIALPIIVVSVSAIGVKTVYAADAVDPFSVVCNDPQATNSSVCPNGNNTVDPVDPLTGPSGIILKVIRLLAAVTGIASIIIIIIAGLKYAYSNGDSNSISSAKSTILYAVVGLLVSVSAQGIIALVINRIK